MIGGDALDLLARAEHEADALVQGGGRDIEDAGAPAGGGTARLLDDEGDRVRLVEQTQPARLVRILAVARIEKNTTAHQDAVRLGDQRGDPAHVEVLPARPAASRETLVDVA